MNLQFSKKQISIIVLTILLIGVLFAGAYYLFIQPVVDKLDQKKIELNMANQELTIIENSLRQANEQVIVSSMELQKEVPVKRLLDQLLLDIEKAEVISDTNIFEVKLNGSQKDEEVKFTEKSEQETDESDEESGSMNEEVLPNGIKKVTIALNGEAKTYFELEKFLSSLKELKRIVKVDELKYSGFDEVYSVEQDKKLVEFEVKLAAYYFPKLEDLQDEIPPLDSPKASNKRNPLSTFADDVEDEEQDQP
ncbi:type IV pilus assembly protein PilO [Cytobacillus eiseniae]|uniref:Type IV pilus assembly protein PilO n=1 Tax=Cytobacillus eiseniae TaxID=762947 RepID=A0ABS4RCI9_9BACI|nr:pilus assembly protein PilO [Cytobacillus eiseniae]MBP2240588.1 type IV pilus assembly protein PilO [Cytobacillus eiseniae]